MQDLGRGFCFGCWTTKGGLQSVCGKCRVGACQKCRALWAEKRKYGATIDEAGLMVNQSNICFCGGHLTPRGAAAYDRKVRCALYAEILSFNCLYTHMIRCSFFYSLICLFMHGSCIHSFHLLLFHLLNHASAHAPARSCTHSCTCSLTHSPTHSPAHPLTHSLTCSPTHSLSHSLTHSLTH